MSHGPVRRGRGDAMKRVTHRRRPLLPVLGFSCASLSALGAAVTNCAASSEPPGTDRTTLLCRARGRGERCRRGGRRQRWWCDPADTTCTTQLASCDEVDWCSVMTGVSPFHVMTSIWGAAANDIWVGGSGGLLIHYDGATWSPATTNVKNTFHAIWGSGSNDVYAVSSTDVVLHTDGVHGSAATWTNVVLPVEPGVVARIEAVWGSSADDIRLGGAPFAVLDTERVSGRRRQSVRQGKSRRGRRILGLQYSVHPPSWPCGERRPTTYGYPLTIRPTGTRRGNTDRRSMAKGPRTGRSASRKSTVNPRGGSHRFEGARRMTSGRSEARVRSVILHRATCAGRSSRLRPWRFPCRLGERSEHVWAVGENGTILHFDGTNFVPSSAQLPLGRKPTLRAIWGSGPNDMWVVGENTALHYTGSKRKGSGTSP